ncbi:MAG TPA: glycosyltransferase, partial [Blastocatellia bacterium]
RAQPTEEQWIRADRMSRLGYFNMLHPDELTPQRLRSELLEVLTRHQRTFPGINLNALPVVTARVESLLDKR